MDRHGRHGTRGYKKTAPQGGFQFVLVALQNRDVGGLWALAVLALFSFEGDLLTLF